MVMLREEVIGRLNKRRMKIMARVAMSYLLEAGVHFGHQTKRWNPKMKEYIFNTRDDIYIMDYHDIYIMCYLVKTNEVKFELSNTL